MGTQRIVGLFLAFVIVFGGLTYFKRKNASSTLRVVTWSNYYPDTVIREFTEKTGIKLELSYISSNEELFSKLKAGATGFDIIQPSDYMVRQMIRTGMLLPLDHNLLGHLSHLDEYYTKLPYDLGLKYSVPFTWGTTGISVNTEKIQVPATGPSWRLLLDSPTPQHTALLDDMREVFSAYLLWVGKPMNTKDAATLEQAKTSISDIKNKILMFSSEPKPLLLKGEIHIAHIYSTDGIQAQIENPKIQYLIPKEGGVIWTDNFAIPKSSIRTKEAHEFINFFLNPENAVKIATENYLALPNKTALKLLPSEMTSNPNLYPSPEVLAKFHFLEDLGETLPFLSRLWTELKSS